MATNISNFNMKPLEKYKLVAWIFTAVFFVYSLVYLALLPEFFYKPGGEWLSLPIAIFGSGAAISWFKYSLERDF